MLFDLNLSPGVAVLQGSGLGGTSLINANAALLCEPKIFQDPVSIPYFKVAQFGLVKKGPLLTAFSHDCSTPSRDFSCFILLENWRQL